MSIKIKQISFLSAIVILISGVIGSGIFFKNASLFQLGQGNIGFVLSVWILAAFGVIALGIGISEMALKSTGSRGVLEWTRSFMPRKLHLSAKNFVQILFIPLICFALPLYAVKGIQEALVYQNIFLSGWAAAGISLLFFLWFAIITFISMRIAEAIQWITLIVKFFPLLILPILSIIMKSDVSSSDWYSHSSNNSSGLSSLGNGGMVLIAGIPAIMFSVDGFYTVTTLRNNLKNPKKMSAVIVIGLAIVIVIYIWVSLSFMNGSKTGKYFDIKWLLEHKNVSQAFSWLISIGILGVVNGYVQYGTNTYIHLHKNNESWLTKWFEEKVFRNKIKGQLSAFLTFMIIVTIVYIILSFIGIYGWHVALANGETQSYANLIQFNEVVTNFKSLLIFVTIALALAFSLKTFRRNTPKQKIIYYISIISIVFVFSVLLYQYISLGVDMSGFRGADKKSSIISFSLLICIPLLSYILGSIEEKFILKKEKNIIKKTAK